MFKKDLNNTKRKREKKNNTKFDRLISVFVFLIFFYSIIFLINKKKECTITTIIFPFFLPYLFFTLCALLVITIVLWTVVIAQRKQLKDFFVFKIMKMNWMKSQFFVWFIIVNLIHISIVLSIVLGYGGFILSAAYLIFFTF